MIGEQRGEGIRFNENFSSHKSRMACRCFWDSDTDNYASEIYSNVSSEYFDELFRILCSALVQHLEFIIIEKLQL